MFSLITSILIIYTITQPLILFSDDLDNLRKEFIHELLDRDIQEGPFSLSYTLKTSIHSNSVISLFGEFSVQDRLPHGWTAYEGRTYFKIADAFEEVKIDDLFPTAEHRDLLKKYCERTLQNNPLSYLSERENSLNPEYINTFVVTNSDFILIFQPYTVAGLSDGPFHLKIPFETLTQLGVTHPLVTSLQQLTHSEQIISFCDF